MIYTPLVRVACNIAYKAHHNDYDKNGYPYIMHPLHVAESMTSEVSTIVALLHDIIEDTDITMDELKEYNFPSEVYDALDLLTRKEHIPYMAYIKRLKGNQIAREVKISDLKHNMNLDRYDKKNIDDKVMSHHNRYMLALEYLTTEDNEE